MALLGSSIDPSLFSNDYSGFARAGAIQGQAYEKLGEDVRAAAEKAAGAVVGVPTGGGGSSAGGAGRGSGGGSGGGIIGKAADMYSQIKQFDGQKKAFGRSMDYMAQAFPDKADMFNSAKANVFDPRASMIDSAAAMNQYQSTFDTIQNMQIQQAKLDMMNQRQQGGGAAAAPKPAVGGVKQLGQ
jgi:hypothetical protein